MYFRKENLFFFSNVMIVYAIAEDIIIVAIKNNMLVINALPPPVVTEVAIWLGNVNASILFAQPMNMLLDFITIK